MGSPSWREGENIQLNQMSHLPMRLEGCKPVTPEPKARVRVFVWNWGIVARISTPSLHLCVLPIQFSPIPRTLDLYFSPLPFTQTPERSGHCCIWSYVRVTSSSFRPSRLPHRLLQPANFKPSLPAQRPCCACDVEAKRSCIGYSIFAHPVIQFRPRLGALFFLKYCGNTSVSENIEVLNISMRLDLTNNAVFG